jgi:hypothetical protein
MVTIQWKTISVAPFKGEGGWRYKGTNAWSCKIEVEKMEEMRGSWANMQEIKGLPF